MADTIDISIIIPTFNRLWTLPKAIDSCRNTICNIEIIVVDDGSTDGTWEWLQTQKDVVSIYQANQGKCWAVNKACTQTKGKYIRFLDSDDAFTKHSIDEMYELALETNSDVVVAGHSIINEKNEIIRTHPWQECDDFIAQQLGECDSSHYSAYLFKKEFINNIPHRPDFAFRDDRIFCVEMAILNPIVVIYDKSGLLHRVHSKSRLQINKGLQESVQHFQQWMLFKFAFQLLEKSQQLTPRRKAAISQSLWPLAHWIAKTHLVEACEIVKWIYELNPNFHIPQKGILGFFYKNLGFKKTEKILKVRRLLISPLFC
jgi:glycosyltransferase involved in cell wall biosynthesis